MKIDKYDLIALLIRIIGLISILVTIAVFEPGISIYIVGAAIMFATIIVGAFMFINSLWASERDSEDTE